MQTAGGFEWRTARAMFAAVAILSIALASELHSSPTSDNRSGLRKLDPQVLLERIKHSDVWAAPDN